MSHFVDVETEIKDIDALVKALIKMGFTKEQIEVSTILNRLNNWQGKPTSVYANVIIRKEHIGQHQNDLGFELQSNGRYIAHIDEGNDYGTEWQKKLYTHYNVEVAKAEYDSMGIQYTETVDSKKRIHLEAYL